MKKTKRKKKNSKKGFFKNHFGNTPLFMMTLLLVAAIALVVIISNFSEPESKNYLNNNNVKIFTNNFANNTELKKFNSAEDFVAYLNNTEGLSYGYYGVGSTRNLALPETAIDMVVEESDSVKQDDGWSGAGRVSDTNVQVLGIDEPDIVKTNGQEIFLSSLNYYYRPLDDIKILEEDVAISDDSKMIEPPYEQPGTKVINAWPIDDLALNTEIPANGNLLLSDDNLVVLSNQTIYGYDVDNADDPTEEWKLALDDNTSLVTARLYNDKIYLVTQQYINRSNPCPIQPIFMGDTPFEVRCTDIYYPAYPNSVDVTFTAMSINPSTGEIDDSVSFVGNYASVIYMSENALYATYQNDINTYDFMYGFLTTDAADLVPTDILARLYKMNGYDISTRAKMAELEALMEEWMESIDDDEMMRVENEIQDRSTDYYQENVRSLYTTGVIKVDIDNLKIAANGKVPGTLLNQFSMDEYDDHLRVATTVGNRWGLGFNGAGQIFNDVYVLDKNLNITGAVTDLGIDERIYSARFVGDQGYLVTYRQVDPFYILDLSDHKNPKMTGELKIPGYSSYLHPITEDKILGIGMEDGRMKLSYFDVSNPSEPKEIDKYNLADYGSEVLYDHHAFLLDKKHEVFFLPSYQGGYIFSYANDELELVRTVSLNNVQRAIYLDDYLYIISPDYMAILDENNWDKVNELDLSE